MFSGMTRSSMKVMPRSIQGLSAGFVRVELHDGDALRIDLDEAQQDG